MKMKTILSLALLAMLSAGPAAYAQQSAGQAAELYEISTRAVEANVEVSINVRGDFQYEIFKLAAAAKLILDLSPVESIQVPSETAVNLAGLLRIRVVSRPGVARVIFDLEAVPVNYRIVKSADGLKVTFWKEASEVAPPATKPEVKPTPETAKVARVEAAGPAPAAKKEKPKFFVQLGGGLGFFLKSTSIFPDTLTLYGEEGSYTETYKRTRNIPAELTFGTYLEVEGSPFKMGLSVQYWNINSDGTYEFSIPHPAVSNSPRTVSLAGPFKSYFANFALFSMFQIFGNEKLAILAGPELGYAFGKYRLLDDINIQDNPPFNASDVTITASSYIESKVSWATAGIRASFEYLLMKKLALTLNLRGFFMSPELAERPGKLNFSQVQALLGLQYNF